MNKVIIFLFLCIILHTFAFAKHHLYHVDKVVDANTIHVLHQGQKIKIRLYGIDAPEKKQNYGKEATFFLKSILQDKKVSFTPINKDRYGRVVAVVYIGGESLQKILLEHGLAWIYPRYCNMAICADWELLQRQAKKMKKGLWQDQNPIPPWEWRKR